jgi:hypothetical protein
LQKELLKAFGRHQICSSVSASKDARTWADYINVGMEHGAFDMTGLEEYMRGLVAARPAAAAPQPAGPGP